LYYFYLACTVILSESNDNFGFSKPVIHCRVLPETNLVLDLYRICPLSLSPKCRPFKTFPTGARNLISFHVVCRRPGSTFEFYGHVAHSQQYQTSMWLCWRTDLSAAWTCRQGGGVDGVLVREWRAGAGNHQYVITCHPRRRRRRFTTSSAYVVAASRPTGDTGSINTPPPAGWLGSRTRGSGSLHRLSAPSSPACLLTPSLDAAAAAAGVFAFQSPRASTILVTVLLPRLFARHTSPIQVRDTHAHFSAPVFVVFVRNGTAVTNKTSIHAYCAVMFTWWAAYCWKRWRTILQVEHWWSRDAHFHFIWLSALQPRFSQQLAK